MEREPLSDVTAGNLRRIGTFSSNGVTTMSEPTGGRNLMEVLESRLPLTGNRGIISEIVESRQRPLVAIALAPGVQLNTTLVAPLLEILDAVPEGPAIDLYMDDLGPICEEDWRLVSLLRERFERYSAILPFAASSGASLVALGANALIMGEASSLAPIEPVPHPDSQADDGLQPPFLADNIQYFVQFLRDDLGLEGVGSDSPTLVNLLDRAGAAKLGAFKKAKMITQLILRRSLETHLNPKTEAARIDTIVERICGGYLSPKFPVTRRDCREELGLEVVEPDKSLWKAIWNLYIYYRRMVEIEGDLVWRERHFSINFDGFIDTIDARRVLVRVDRTDEHGHPIADRPVIRRWVHPGGSDVVMDESIEL